MNVVGTNTFLHKLQQCMFYAQEPEAGLTINFEQQMK